MGGRGHIELDWVCVLSWVGVLPLPSPLFFTCRELHGTSPRSPMVVVVVSVLVLVSVLCTDLLVVPEVRVAFLAAPAVVGGRAVMRGPGTATAAAAAERVRTRTVVCHVITEVITGVVVTATAVVVTTRATLGSADRATPTMVVGRDGVC